MPVNVHEEQKKAYNWLNNFLINEIPKDGIHINEIKFKVLLKFAISQQLLIDRINECYIDLGKLSIKDGIIKR